MAARSQCYSFASEERHIQQKYATVWFLDPEQEFSYVLLVMGVCCHCQSQVNNNWWFQLPTEEYCCLWLFESQGLDRVDGTYRTIVDMGIIVPFEASPSATAERKDSHIPWLGAGCQPEKLVISCHSLSCLYSFSGTRWV